MNEIDKLKEIFLTEVDEETQKENLAQIQEWETALIEHEAYLDWQEHDITKAITAQARSTYRDAAVVLAQNRQLTDAERAALWAKQDAALWLLSITDKDAKGAIAQIKREIHTALNATK